MKNATANSIKLEEKYLTMLRSIVLETVDTQKWQPVIFGSRANGRAWRFSDIDLGFRGASPLPDSVISRLDEALDDSDLPYVVDVVDLSATSAEFRQLAESEAVRL